jgi:hypothetical protein
MNTIHNSWTALFLLYSWNRNDKFSILDPTISKSIFLYSGSVVALLFVCAGSVGSKGYVMWCSNLFIKLTETSNVLLNRIIFKFKKKYYCFIYFIVHYKNKPFTKFVECWNPWGAGMLTSGQQVSSSHTLDVHEYGHACYGISGVILGLDILINLLSSLMRGFTDALG